MVFPAFVHSTGDGSQDVVFSAGDVLDCLSDGVIATDASDDRTIVWLLDAEREARTDPLTGLPNRSHIDDILGGGGWLVTRARATIVVDVDHFKDVNDTYGHVVGDEVLRQVARRLAATARSGDIVARWGGEEFCIPMFGQDDADAHEEPSTRLARRIVEVIAGAPFHTSAGDLSLTVSAGSASLSSSSPTAPDLLHAADRAMYAAKRHGRNRAEQG